MDFQDVGSGSVLVETAQVCQAQRKNLQYHNPQAEDVKRTRGNINKEQQSHTGVQPCTDAGAGAAVLADESVSKDQAAL